MPFIWRDKQTLQKVLASWIQQKKELCVMYHDPAGFILEMNGRINIWKSVNLILHIYKLIQENHLVLSIKSEKTLNKTKNLFMIKTLSRLGIEKNFLNLKLIKDIYTKPASNIIHVFLLRLRIRHGCSLSQLLYNIVLEVVDNIVRHDKEIKGIQIGKEERKLSLFAYDMVW